MDDGQEVFAAEPRPSSCDTARQSFTSSAALLDFVRAYKVYVAGEERTEADVMLDPFTPAAPGHTKALFGHKVYLGAYVQNRTRGVYIKIAGTFSGTHACDAADGTLSLMEAARSWTEVDDDKLEGWCRSRLGVFALDDAFKYLLPS